MNREEIRKKIGEIGIVAAIRVRSKENALFAAEAVTQGGIPVVEISLTAPGALEVISHLVKQNPELIVGAGSVLNLELAQASLDAGAKFLTSDGLRLPLVEFGAKKGVVVFPGALTPSEVLIGWDSGCDFVKVVPCSLIGGAKYIASLHKMFPNIPLIAAGGVNQQTASEYIIAGAVALGVGAELTPSQAIRNREVGRIHELARRFLGFVKDAREGVLPSREGNTLKMPD
jgi:2-dehydro-3-deoxyphosphogluconate aldolase / (4S)-4-hydroxy-2-oxoglutarate aldolase